MYYIGTYNWHKCLIFQDIPKNNIPYDANIL